MKTRFVPPSKSTHNSKLSQPGFTIVELLVVIVVIAILAAITIVAYTGISQKAVASALQSDLTNAQKQLKLYYVDNGSYPTALTLSGGTYCPTPTDTRYCVKASNGNTFSYTSEAPYSTFTLTATNTASTITYRITDNTAPVLVTIIPITAIAAITGTTSVGSVLTAGSLTPSGANATATYQWQSATSSGGTYTNISGATSNTYTLQASDLTKYIKVVATATGDYTGTQTSAASTVVTEPIWIASAGGASMTGKYVYYMDAPGGYTWYNRDNGCISPGRSPTLAELHDIFSYKESYGTFQAWNYWSSTEYGSSNAYLVNRSDHLYSYNAIKTTTYDVRCVSG